MLIPFIMFCFLTTDKKYLLLAVFITNTVIGIINSANTSGIESINIYRPLK